MRACERIWIKERNRGKYSNIRFSWGIRFSEFSGKERLPLFEFHVSPFNIPEILHPFTAIILNVVSSPRRSSPKMLSFRFARTHTHTLAFIILFAHTYHVLCALCIFAARVGIRLVRPEANTAHATDERSCLLSSHATHPYLLLLLAYLSLIFCPFSPPTWASSSPRENHLY